MRARRGMIQFRSMIAPQRQPVRHRQNKTSKAKRKNQYMPKLNEVFSGGFLKAEDLGGKSPRVTIERVEVKDFDDGKKLIIHFEGKDKALVCNKTNASIIEEVLGSDDTDVWEGKRITLTTRKVEFQGKLVPAIRVVLEESKAPAPVKSADVEIPEDSDSIPF